MSCCPLSTRRQKSGIDSTTRMNRLATTSSGRSRLSRKALLCAVVLVALHSSRTSAFMTPDAWNFPSADERQRIDAVLETYTSSVSAGDSQRFESQLLDLKIPFSGVWSELPASANLVTIQDYAGFRKSIFESGKQFKQRFSNIRIEQVGSVAQVSLDYETALKDAAFDGKGWKVLHLLKVDGRWKIASEFFTRYPR
ncbi:MULTISPECIES: nuclear transport factor 2 family protein [unclassified Rhizobacter]|uniref:nuclear transport factor 2 family protein n=1 Tax=unclassified Rhizobacter TaxID=2640088 RepID=UPI0012FAC302|nr:MULTISPECIES: nuclear transport factor 2 family protein [unclassified Rhizobacter]